VRSRAAPLVSRRAGLTLCCLAAGALAGLLAGAVAAEAPDAVSLSPAEAEHAPRVVASGTTPEPVRALLDGCDPADYEGQDLVTVFDSVDVRVEESGLSYRRHHTLHKVLTPSGARARAALRFDYDPASNQIAIERIRVHRGDSSFIALDPARAVDVTAPAHMIYWGARMKVLALPRLEVGDAVEVETEMMGFQIAYLLQVDEDLERFIPPMRGHFYDTILFQGHWPIERIHYRLELPREKLAQYSVYNGEVYSALTYTDSTLVYRWWMKDQPPVADEPRAPDWSDFVPKVVLATVPDWPAKSRWFQQVNEPVFEWNAEIAAQVEELTAGCETTEEELAALLHWVADNIRYSGLNMGEGEGYTLHPGIMTWEDRCGVCKDIAGMLVTMLRAAGYETYPAMTMAGARVERIPADQFNHCVVAVRHADGSYTMLDPTWAPQSADIWSHYEGEQHYVIGSPEGEGLDAIRSFAPDENRLDVRFETAVDAAGDLTGEVTLSGAGAADTRLRGNMTYRTRYARDALATAILAPISPAVEVLEAHFGDYTDYSRPMRYRFRFRVPRYAAVNDSVCDLLLPSARFLKGNPRFVRSVEVPAVPDRSQPALFWATALAEVEETLQLPGRFAAATALPAQSLTRPAARLEARSELEGSALRVFQEIALEKRTVPASEWHGVVEVADSLGSFAATRVHLTR